MVPQCSVSLSVTDCMFCHILFLAVLRAVTRMALYTEALGMPLWAAVRCLHHLWSIPGECWICGCLERDISTIRSQPWYPTSVAIRSCIILATLHDVSPNTAAIGQLDSQWYVDNNMSLTQFDISVASLVTYRYTIEASTYAVVITFWCYQTLILSQSFSRSWTRFYIPNSQYWSTVWKSHPIIFHSWPSFLAYRIGRDLKR